MKYYFQFFILSGLIIIMSSCLKEDIKPGNRGFLHGLYIVNEGNFMSNNGSISYYNPDSAKMVNKVFQSVNKMLLGDVVQSFGVADDLGFIVVNNSQKVEVVDMETFLSVGTITGTDYPRNFIKISKSKDTLQMGLLQVKYLLSI